MSDREIAARCAMTDALAMGHSIGFATAAAQKAAYEASPKPMDTPKSDILTELAEALGYRVVEVELSDVLSLDNADTDLEDFGPDVSTTEMIEADEFLKAVYDHEEMERDCGVHLVAPDHIQLTIDARRAAKLEGNCEDGYEYEPGGLVAQAISDAAKEHGDEPVDMGPDGAGTFADAWRDGVSIKTPMGLRIKAKAAFMAGLSDDLDAEKDHVGADEGCQCEDCREEPVRDCDIPATLRAIELPATEDHNAYRLWFDGDDEMQQFLAGRCLYADADRSIKDRDGKVVGMWFYAHFGPTPVS